jgi:hypothetical protein
MGAQRTYFHSPDIFRPEAEHGKSAENAAVGAWRMLQMPRQTPQQMAMDANPVCSLC